MKFLMFVFASLWISSSISLAQSPWVDGKFKGYTHIGFSVIQYADIFDETGEVVSAFQDVTDVTLQSYTELGLSERFGLKLNIPLKILQKTAGNNVTNETPEGDLQGIGNIMFGAKYVLLNKSLKITGGVDISTNTFSSENTLGLRTGFEAWTFNPYISIGKGFTKFYAFGALGLGLMTNDYSHFVNLNGEIGYNAFKRFFITTFLDFRVNFENGTFGQFENQVYRFSALYTDNMSFLGIGLKASYGFTDKMGINANASFAFGGRNVAAAPALGASVYLKW